ncbi:MAG: hypothetical protein Q7S70_01780 [bacterium]|nr:hypothetical protein [bacterium]
MEKIKFTAAFFAASVILLLLFSPEIFPDNSQFKDFLGSSKEKIVIIFNSGGWGNTPLDQADDFNHIVKGIQETLLSLGYDSPVVPYERTKNDFWGKITAAKEAFRSFDVQSNLLAGEIESFLRSNPDKKIIMAGLSNGAAFEESTVEKISEDVRSRVFVIEAGTPFWERKTEALDRNVLRLDNQGKDLLAVGQAKSLVFSLARAPFKWISKKFSDKNIALARAFEVAGHYYYWPEVKPEITVFLENNLKQ